MGEEQSLVKLRFIMTDTAINAHARERFERLFKMIGKGKRDQGRGWRDDGKSKLFRDFIAVTARAHFRNGRPAAGNHEFTAVHRLPCRGDDKARFAIFKLTLTNIQHICPEPKLGFCIIELCEEHINDLLGLTVAKQLTLRLFMPRNTVAVDELYKITGFITR